MVASVGALASAKTNDTAIVPRTAEITASVQMARRGDKRPGMQHAEVLGSFIVLAHCVGHAGAGVHAAERGADQREEHRDRFSQHEVLAMPLAEQSIADDDHHVADWAPRSLPRSASCTPS